VVQGLAQLLVGSKLERFFLLIHLLPAKHTHWRGGVVTEFAALLGGNYNLGVAELGSHGPLRRNVTAMAVVKLVEVAFTQSFDCGPHKVHLRERSQYLSSRNLRFLHSPIISDWKAKVNLLLPIGSLGGRLRKLTAVD